LKRNGRAGYDSSPSLPILGNGTAVTPPQLRHPVAPPSRSSRKKRRIFPYNFDNSLGQQRQRILIHLSSLQITQPNSLPSHRLNLRQRREFLFLSSGVGGGCARKWEKVKKVSKKFHVQVQLDRQVLASINFLSCLFSSKVATRWFLSVSRRLAPSSFSSISSLFRFSCSGLVIRISGTKEEHKTGGTGGRRHRESGGRLQGQEWNAFFFFFFFFTTR